MYKSLLVVSLFSLSAIACPGEEIKANQECVNRTNLMVAMAVIGGTITASTGVILAPAVIAASSFFLPSCKKTSKKNETPKEQETLKSATEGNK